MNEWTVFSYDGVLPIYVGLNNNLKMENVFPTTSQIILKSPKYYIKQINNLDYTAIITSKIDMDTNQSHFIRGFLYINNNEYPILNYNKYSSLQIENSCFDNINGIQIQR